MGTDLRDKKDSFTTSSTNQPLDCSNEMMVPSNDSYSTPSEKIENNDGPAFTDLRDIKDSFATSSTNQPLDCLNEMIASSNMPETYERSDCNSSLPNNNNDFMDENNDSKALHDKKLNDDSGCSGTNDYVLDVVFSVPHGAVPMAVGEGLNSREKRRRKATSPCQSKICKRVKVSPASKKKNCKKNKTSKKLNNKLPAKSSIKS